jgi:hypothetical protein
MKESDQAPIVLMQGGRRWPRGVCQPGLAQSSAAGISRSRRRFNR